MENKDPLKAIRQQKKGSRIKRALIWLFSSLIVIIILVFLAFKLSPWPSVLLIRHYLPDEGPKTAEALKKHIPGGISAVLEQQYDRIDKDAFLDVYYPSAISGTDQVLPVIVWVHGGGWIGGSKEGMAGYCKILAGKGYTVVAVDYSLAPGKHYPTPVKQVNTALAYLRLNAKRLHIDAAHFILAGDSGGASIAAQLGNITSNSGYAHLMGIVPAISRAELSGLILYCGPYDVGMVDLNGKSAFLLNTLLWAYNGKKDFINDPFFKTLSVVNYLNSDFPPCFISVGNGDPLKAHSEALARKLALLHVKVDTLFYPPNYIPNLPHEYQFNLDIDAGKKALERSLHFLSDLNMTNGK